MKTQYLYILILIVYVVFASCKKDETKTSVSPEPVAPEISKVNNGFAKIITVDNLGEQIIFEWSEANYGVQSQITYTLEIDSTGFDFTEPVVLGSGTTESLEMSLGDLNDKLLNDLGVTPNVESSLQLRVIASLNGKLTTISEVVNISITTYKEIIPDNTPAMLWLPGGYQGWDPPSAPTIKAVSETVFEGYVYINAGTGFKFTSAPDWDHINYGDSGTPGVLTTDGLADGLSIHVAGYYKFVVDVENLTYEIVLINSWGLVGTATPGGWDTDTDMDFDQGTGLWTKTMDLASGALKFRANDGWDINYGPADSNELIGTLIQTNDAINISEAGNYTIVMDLSRNEDPYVYQYSVTKN